MKILIKTILVFLFVMLFAMVTNGDASAKEPEKGDIIVFGSFEQDGNTENGQEGLEWIVLDAEDGITTMITRYGLEPMPYNDVWAPTIWENSTLRNWLNEDFPAIAFSDKEKEKLQPALLIPASNPDIDTDQGTATMDKVFLLSVQEAEQYFPTDEARVCIPTNMAVIHGASVSGNSTSNWWLRTTGEGEGYAALILDNGFISEGGFAVDSWNNVVRPVIQVKLEAEWEYYIVQEKGKTVLHVSRSEPDPENKEYRIYVYEGETDKTSKRAVAMKLSANNGYSETYDFSSELMLPSGTYSFAVREISESAPETDDSQYEFDYDENYKFIPDITEAKPADDLYGNEREFRRLINQRMLASDQGTDELSLSEIEDALKDNMRKRYHNAGVPDGVIDTVFEYLDNCDQTYRDVFLYGFYSYYIEQKYLGFTSFFNPDSPAYPVINITVFNMHTDSLKKRASVIFHESGHALEFCAGNGAYYSSSANLDLTQRELREDLDALIDYIEDEVSKEYAGVTLNDSGDGQFRLFAEKCGMTLLSPEKTVSRESCEDMSDMEYEAFQWVLKLLSDQMPWAYNEMAGADMRDVLCGITGNKIRRDFEASHTIGYWWDVKKDQLQTENVLNEAWAEFFAAKMMDDTKLMETNSRFFPNLCDAFQKQAATMSGILATYCLPIAGK